MSAISVMLAERGHLSFIPEIELAAAAIFSSNDLPTAVRFRVTDTVDLLSAQQAARLWVAVKEDDRPVGFTIANEIDGEAYLQEISVLPEFGRRGIGAKLVNTVVAWSGEAGFASIVLVTFKHLPWNAPFYAKLGFRNIQPAAHGPEISRLFEEEKCLGIDTNKRVAMRLIN